jgi:transposase
VKDIAAAGLIADRGYDTDEIIAWAQNRGITAVIPPKKNRKRQRPYDERAYRLRCRIENTFLRLKQWRSIATRYAKNAASFFAAVCARSIFYGQLDIDDTV